MLVATFVVLMAQTPHLESVVETHDPKPNFISLRVGASTGDENERPQLCLEGAPLAFLKVDGKPLTGVRLEACGTGAGILHDDTSAEMAHFRVKGRLLQLGFEGWSVEALAGLGLAELQLGRDTPGFRLTDAGPANTNTAGPEGTLHLAAKADAGGGFDVVADLALGVAYLPFAPEISQTFDTILPTVSLSLGLGF